MLIQIGIAGALLITHERGKMKNKKIKSYLLFLFVTLLLLVLACGKEASISDQNESSPASDVQLPADVQTPADNQPTSSSSHNHDNVILFKDDFQDGQAENWQTTQAWNVQQNGDVYYYEAKGEGITWLPQGNNWGNYGLRSKVLVDNNCLVLSINMTKSGRYLLNLCEDGISLQREKPAGKFTEMVKTCPFETGKWHDVWFGIQNGHIQVYVDKALWIDAGDHNPLPTGTIALGALDGSNVKVDDVLVTQLTKPLASVPIQAPTNCNTAALPVIEAPEVNIAMIPIEDNVSAESSNGKPDLVIKEAFFGPDEVPSGQPFSANFAIRNEGDADSGAFTLRWNFNDKLGVSVCSWDYDNLAPGETVMGGCVRTSNARSGKYSSSLIVDAEKEVEETNETNNRMQPMLQILGENQDNSNNDDNNNGENSFLIDKPDLVIHYIGHDPDPILVGEPFVIHYELENVGGKQSGACNSRVIFEDAMGVPVCSDNFTTIQSGIINTMDCQGVTNAPPGQYKVRIVVDLEDEVDEINENNNEVTFTLLIVQASNGNAGVNSAEQPDLKVSVVAFDPPPVKGQPTTGTFIVWNEGPVASGPFSIRWKFNPSTGIPDCIKTVDNIAPHDSIVVACEGLQSEKAGNFSTTIFLDYLNQVAERNEDNNIHKETLKVNKQ